MAIHTRLARQARTTINLNTVAARAAAATSGRRLRGQPRDPAWSLTYQGVVEMLAQSMPEHCDSPALLREIMNGAAMLSPGNVAATTAVNAGGVPAIWTGEADAPRFLLYLHGGGYVCGSPWTHLGLIQQIARETGARVLALDYRLAPEAPYPAALEDAWLAYWWLLQQGAEPARIAVAGDSAGGGLTVALLLALRDAGVPLPAAGVCLSPWLDLAHTSRTLRTNQNRDYLKLPLLYEVAHMYAGGVDAHNPLVSPLYADLHGLPPLLVQVGTDEMLLDDATRFARRDAGASGCVELELWETMVHVWQFFYTVEPRARQAIKRIGCFVRAHAEVETAYGSTHSHRTG